MKIPRTLSTAVFCLFVSVSAFAADTYPGPHEAGPDIYRQLFENNEVRVSEIQFDPGDKIAMHHHTYGHSIYILEAGQLTLSYPNGKTVVMDAKKGEVLWMGVEDHAAVNTGKTVFRALITEVKSSVR